MVLIVDNPDRFFSNLVEESNQAHDISASEDVRLYLREFLIKLVADHSLVELERSLSLVYLQACYDGNKDDLKLVGDSCLFMLGLYPNFKKQHQSLYYDLGPSSYEGLTRKSGVYKSLASQFDRAVNLLLGVGLLLNESPEYRCNLWFATENSLIHEELRQDNIIPLKARND